MNILFCNEGFIIDGVASYNLYLSAALKKADHHVAILGRWAGFKGFQHRHRQFGVQVLQSPPFAVDNPVLIRRGIKFNPDVIITDSRRAFPLAKGIKEKTGAKMITVFHDSPQLDRKGNRGIDTIQTYSEAWVTPEKPIWEEIQKIRPQIPVLWIQRPISDVVNPTPILPRDPFRVLCLGRLSRWKSPGFKIIIERAHELRRFIPSIEIIVVGGGRRGLNFRLSAWKQNRVCGKRFVKIVGARTNPQPFIQSATVVCAGATSAIEAILSNRPVMALSGFWMGLITENNLASGVSSHFAERWGECYIRDDPDIVIRGLIDLYQSWKNEKIAKNTEKLRTQLALEFDASAISLQFQNLFNELRKD